MIILAIETSHDDTSLAILKDNQPIWMKTISQTDIHKQYGGTIPEIASRLHVKNIALILDDLFKSNANICSKIDYIAYTKEPGLIGSLQIGYIVAQSLSRIYKVPILGLNHLEGHFYSAFIKKELEFPALSLLVSGGHSQIMFYKSQNEFEIIGETQDDAVGEVYDKVARKLNLGFPGGPLIDKIWLESKDVYLDHFSIPQTEKKLNFSFSGIKTAVINYINNLVNKKQKININKIATEFQNTIVMYLKKQFSQAIEIYKPKCISLVGGVSANKAIRNMILELHKNVYLPEMEYTTDNAMMIARLAYEKVRK
ncbi:tRNA (adenosine(37)-N6)-threonylcarbamoyltransferase complex transferase subunit TsaD [Mycoplasma enhydrae]|uniref:tRNA (adenosine(37)-N6)-threonylcarbamoyltransferase complex transferase subunit TsaD n=1 Tax=Mycoplasma enhydrae TaxID=2499220 RepID=UPI00197B6CFB|nr:tRNA (adenosine(37)-N6)-threonylcarbamoyltransferase complex transferase subunit TsaD [Mycoplasma enhydrae]MBN4089214.1 tRNA (adenosine(37)-N6)-threonylcarbamoyltransferase complex transferase subunit TsaD [Mycoplasma enhydrae]MCV3733875.1 tRNA (adenosine(37)-N6)-threonylcarbamoyltransferase complex transferase subunit TsaD [Mycoplasma enhydrae]MCV3753658.1 tRNA (adenosine(37)-N6)-threonylcarbamoyltransferase complex transferase subunit TsaD [Mycoplasma enhydrae]